MVETSLKFPPFFYSNIVKKFSKTRFIRMFYSLGILDDIKPSPKLREASAPFLFLTYNHTPFTSNLPLTYCIFTIPCYTLPMSGFSDILPYIQILLSVLIIAGVVLQRGDPDLGSAFGGSDTLGASYHTRRGFEKILFNGTIIFGILFAATSFLTLII
ncbi:MAG TPA: preprotein translocase subunit SecG [Candidatus Paceibacterota bacterium]